MEKPLIVVGNFSSHTYKTYIMDIINKKPEKKVIFTGGIYNQDILNMLRQNCFAYIHGHAVGGTNPSLLEIMTMKTVIIAYKSPYNEEVCGNSVIYFKDVDELIGKIKVVDLNINNFHELKEKSLANV